MGDVVVQPKWLARHSHRGDLVSRAKWETKALEELEEGERELAGETDYGLRNSEGNLEYEDEEKEIGLRRTPGISRYIAHITTCIHHTPLFPAVVY